MPSLASNVNVNIDDELKEQANSLFNSLGLNMSTAINMFLKKSISDSGIPFQVKRSKPSRELLKALKEVERIEKGELEVKKYKSVKELIEDLEDGI